MKIDDFSERLVDADELEIEVNATLAEVLERLDEHVDSGFVGILASEGLVGRISPESVTLHYRHPLYRNSGKAIFRGTLREEAGAVRLVGRFTLTRFTTIFIVLQAVLLAAMGAIGAISQLLKGDLSAAMIILAAVAGFAVASGAFFMFLIKLGRRDIPKIERGLREALEEK